jgi:magnesium transporter
MKIKSLFETKKFFKKAGEIPGSLSEHPSYFKRASIQFLYYNQDNYGTQPVEEASEIALVPDINNWINIVGLNDYEAIKKIGESFNIHSLILEDVLNTDHLPKFEFSQHHMFFTLKLPEIKENGVVELYHMSFIVGANYLITAQEGESDHLSMISDRIENFRGRVREKGIMFLFYSIIDYIIDQYFPLMEKLRDQIEDKEDLIIDYPHKNHIADIQEIKKHIVLLRKYITSTSKALYKLINEENKFIDRPIKLFFNDIYDHITHLQEQLDTFKEYQTTLLEMNMANISNNMNKVMKTLTIVASIFIPLTFIAGIYGMNFANMPELQWEYGYPVILILMAIVAIILVVFMKRKEWF